jgi:hypothetical protein
MTGPGAARLVMETTLDNENVSALFLNLVLSQSSMALMLLGKSPNPQTGETVRDLEAARMLIDQLEMLQVKTRGNLTPDEDALLKQSLTTLRLSFVEAVDQPAGTPAGRHAQPAPGPTAETPAAAKSSEGAAPESEESRKKFSKKY